jgi:LysM repeat protein
MRFSLQLFWVFAYTWLFWLIMRPLQAQDSLREPSYIARQIVYNNKYDFINYSANYFTWQNPAALQYFFESLAQTSNRKLKIVHIGDSHIQADIVTGHIRNNLQNIFGAGGRGLIFPYAAAATHPGYDYLTYARGKWDYARNVFRDPSLPIGLTGVSIKTSDLEANFRIAFNQFYKKENSTLLKVYCKKGSQAFDLVLRYDNIADTMRLVCQDTLRSYVEAYLPLSPMIIDIGVAKTGAMQNNFECYGLSLENPADKGILYHSVGINGANFSSILQQKLMPRHLREINPDLVVIDLGANEFYGGGFDPEDYEMKLRNLVHLIRKASPAANILLVSVQDAYRSISHNVAECKRAAEITEKVALTMNCGYYDFYAVSGGQYSMLNWRRFELAKNDRIHLSYTGYVTKAELFTNALLNTYYLYLKGNLQPPFDPQVLPKPKFINYIYSQPVVAKAPSAVFMNAAGTRITSQHTVQRGENLTLIAARYQTTVYALKKWNNLRNDFIAVGQKLWIIDPNGAPVTQASEPVIIPTKDSGKRFLTYTVKPGDNLYRIALAHKVTVPDLQNWNRLTSTQIKVGQRLNICVSSQDADTRPTSEALSDTSLLAAASEKVLPAENTLIPEEQQEQTGEKEPEVKPTPQPPKKKWHIIEAGDTLWSLSKKYNTTVEELRRINYLPDNRIAVGKRLLLP